MQLRPYNSFVYLLLLTGLFLPASLVAQLNNLSFKHLTPNDGLTQSVITSVYTDTKGFVWMTGLDGINRFDGLKCLANAEIAPGLQNLGATIKILEDKNGDIWFGTDEGVIQYSYRNNRFTEHKINQFDSSENRKNITEKYLPLASDYENNLLIGGHYDWVILYNILTGQTRYYYKPGIFSAQVLGFNLLPGKTSLMQGFQWILRSRDSIWVCTWAGRHNGVQLWNNKSIPWQGDVVESVWMPDKNTLFFYSGERICKYYLSTGIFSFSPVIKTYSQSVAFMPDTKGRLWLGGIKNGLQVLDTASMQVLAHINHSIQRSSGISSNSVYAYIDRNQMLWVPAWGKGLDYANLDEERFTSFVTAEEAKTSGFSNFIRGIIQAPDGDFFCSTLSGIVVLDKNLHFKNMLPGTKAGFAYPDIFFLAGKLYYGSDELPALGLYQYDLRTGATQKLVFINENNEKKNLQPYQISKTNNNDLLIATMQGLWKLNVKKQKIETLPGITPPIDIAEAIVCSYEDKQGQVYKCINNLGFAVYRKTGELYKEVFAFDRKTTVKYILPKNDSLLWMGTSGGLYLFDTKQLKMTRQYSMQDGLPNNVVYAMIPDENNNLWLSTNKGLSYFDISQNTFSNFTQ